MAGGCQGSVADTDVTLQSSVVVGGRGVIVALTLSDPAFLGAHRDRFEALIGQDGVDLLCQFGGRLQLVGEGLQRFFTVMRFLASHATAGLVVRGAEARMNFRWGARAATGYPQVCLATAGSFLNTLRIYLGPMFLPDEIHLDMARPSRATSIEAALPTRIFFDADEISLRFPKALLKTARGSPLTGRPLTLSDVRRRVLTGPPRGIETAVKELIRIQVVNGGPSFDQTSRALNMNGRTLRRLLDRSGEGFRDLATRIRLETAEELLRETEMPVRAVAQAVGYSDPYNFSRAFNNRYGCRPTAVRGL